MQMSDVSVTASQAHFPLPGSAFAIEPPLQLVSPELAAKLADEFAGLDLFGRVAAIRSLVPGQIVFTTSFGLEAQALAHAIFSQGLTIDVATLDTGRLFRKLTMSGRGPSIATASAFLFLHLKAAVSSVWSRSRASTVFAGPSQSDSSVAPCAR